MAAAEEHTLVAARRPDALQVRGYVACRALLLRSPLQTWCLSSQARVHLDIHRCMFWPRRQFPQLSGREDLILKLVTEKYHEIVDRHQHRVVDGRAETHLQVLRQDSAAAEVTCAHDVFQMQHSSFQAPVWV
jgi:hypothetical protein